MSRIMKFLTVFLCLLTFSSCDVGAIMETIKDLDYETTRDETSQETCEKVFKYLKNRDTDALTSLFCTEVKNTCSLETEINNLYEYMGNIESYEEIDISSGVDFHFVYDTPSNMLTRNSIEVVKTDKNNYQIVLYHNPAWENEDCEGLQEIRVRTTDEDYDSANWIIVGKVVETIDERKLPKKYGKIKGNDSVDIRYTFGENLLYALKTKDKNKLEKMFAQPISTQSNFDTSLTTLIEFMDGKPITYSGVDGGSGGKEVRDWELVEMQEHLTIYDIMTDSGKMYEIKMYAYIIDKNNPENEGIHSLEIREVDKELTNLEHEMISNFIIEES